MDTLAGGPAHGHAPPCPFLVLESFHLKVRSMFFNIILFFIYTWVFTVAQLLSSHGAQASHLFFTYTWVFLVAQLLSSCGAQASQCSGFSCSREQALGHSGLRSGGSWVLDHRLSSWSAWVDRDRTHVSCIGRWMLYHCAAQEALK